MLQWKSCKDEWACLLMEKLLWDPTWSLLAFTSKNFLCCLSELRIFWWMRWWTNFCSFPLVNLLFVQLLNCDRTYSNQIYMKIWSFCYRKDFVIWHGCQPYTGTDVHISWICNPFWIYDCTSMMHFQTMFAA